MTRKLARLGAIGPRSGFAATLSVAVMLLFATAAQAVLPAAPQLERESREALVKALADVGIPEAGASAVLITLLRVLDTAPASRRRRYREPYPQLPDVDATATPAGKGCARVQLTAKPKAAPNRPVKLAGIYCLVDTAAWTWRARAQTVKAD